MRLGAWIRDAIAHAGMNQVELGRRLSEKLGRNYPQSMINKMALDQRDVQVDEVVAIMELTNAKFPLRRSLRRVPIMGGLREGGVIIMYAEPIGYEELPLDSDADVLALEVVSGPSQGFGYKGWTLFYTKERMQPTNELIGVPVAVRLRDGRLLARALRAGSELGKFALAETMWGEPEIDNAEIEWVSPMVWVKPRTLHT
jgi:hypothetical protein